MRRHQYLNVRKSEPLDLAETFRGKVRIFRMCRIVATRSGKPVLEWFIRSKFISFAHDLLQLPEEPLIDLGQVVDLVDRRTFLESLRQIEDSLGVRNR